MKIYQNTAIYCNTKELSQKVAEVAEFLGLKYCGDEFTTIVKYMNIKGNDCMRLENGGGFCNRKWYKNNGYKIITAEEFLKGIIIKKEEMKSENNQKYLLTKSTEVAGLKRDITVGVYLQDGKLYGGYAVRNPIDKKVDIDKAKLIAHGRAFNVRTNLLKGESVGSMTHRYILKAIAENILREIESGKIIIKGIR